MLLPVLVIILTNQHAHAGSATWNLDPTSDDWNTASNWTPATVPNNASDTASFDVSNTTSIKFSADTDLAAIVFDPGASSYTIATAFDLNLGGAGIVNNSGVEQNFVALGNVGKIHFRNANRNWDVLFNKRKKRSVCICVLVLKAGIGGNGTKCSEGAK